MNPADRQRACACGTLLAHDNAGALCSACLIGRHGDSSAPEMPANFWDHAPLLDALANRHMGQVIREWRCHPSHGRRPVPQERVAEWAHVTQPQLSRIENGRPIKDLDRLTHLATLLRVPPRLLWFDLPHPAPRRTASELTPCTTQSGVTGSAELRAPIDPAELATTLKRRHLQVALDVTDLDEAVRLDHVAACNHADLVEVGDPLLKPFGMGAVREIRAAIPEVPIVVEFSSSDWIDEQIDLAVTAGADIVLVLGLDHPSRIERAVRTARASRVGIVLAVPPNAECAQWCSTAENAGADAISIIRNIDSAESVAATSARLRHVATVANVPLAVSGGFNPDNVGGILDDQWSILIVGGAFVRSREPGTVLQSLRRTIESRS